MWKPGQTQPEDDAAVLAPSLDLVDEDVGVSVVYNPKRHLPLEQQRRSLPIYPYLETSRTVIVVGEPGCGKSTQLPQYLMEAGWCTRGQQIVVVMPRRLAATMLAGRVAEEVGDGAKVGFATSVESSLSSSNMIRYVTDGVLLREIQADPLLRDASVVIMDDCHERRVESDVCVGLLKKIQKKRPYLRVVVCSATIDLEAFVNFFREQWMTDEDPKKHDVQQRKTRWDTPKEGTIGGPLNAVSILTVTSRPYPVAIRYLKEPCSDYVQAALSTILRIHCTQRDTYGILVFLCGRETVETLVDELKDAIEVLDTRLRKAEVAPLYSGLSAEAQLAALRRPKPEYRKIVVATNIAESSVTIENIGYVVDCGYYKTTFYDGATGVTTLSAVPISLTSAIQRAGRAGRTRPGVCYRLYPETVLSDGDVPRLIPEFSIPEVLRTSLAQVLLYLLSLGVQNFVTQLELPTPVSSTSVIDALTDLHALQAVDDFGRLTRPLGERMAELPLSPKLARFVLIAAEEPYNCSYEAVIIAAMVFCGSPWIEPHPKSRMKRELREACMRSIGVAEGDLVTLYNVYKQTEFYRDEDSTWASRHMINIQTLKRVEKVKRRLESYLKGWDVPVVSCGSDVPTLCKAICGAFFLNACQRQRDGTYALCRKPSTSRATAETTSETAVQIPPMILHPLSIANPKQPVFVVFGEAVATTTATMKSGCTMLSQVTPIDPRWLRETAGHYFHLDLGDDAPGPQEHQLQESKTG